MDIPLLDTLVRLASIGATGICIFVVFWAGYQLQKIPHDAPPIRYETFRSYMLLCVLVALISAGVGALNAYFNYRQALVERERANSAIAKAESESKRAEQITDQLQAREQEFQALAETSKQLDDERKRLEARLAAAEQETRELRSQAVLRQHENPDRPVPQ